MILEHASRSAGVLLLLAGACARERRPVEAAMKEAVRAGHAPATVVARIRDGRIECHAEGMADLAHALPATPETAFLFFSVTKLFTAAAVMQLVEEGAISLDEPVHAYLSLPLSSPAERITVRHLLAHTSGIANPWPITWVHLESEPAPELQELTSRLLRQHPRLEFEPGSRYGYSNLGYLVLGVLVERISGMRFEEYVQRRILEPLQMRASGFDLRGKPLATGYYQRFSLAAQAMKLLLDARLVGAPAGRFGSFRRFLVDGAPYGGLVGSCPDLARFVAALAGDGSFQGARILSPASAAAMRTPQRDLRGAVLPVGLGWRLGTTGGKPDLRATGGGGGYKTEVRVLAGTDRAVVVAANQTTFDTGDIAVAALR